MAPRQQQPKKESGLDSPMVEFGATGLRQFSGYVREEWLRQLVGWRGLRVFREMRDNDPIIGAMFFAIEMLLRGVTFTVKPVSNSPEDIEASDFVNSCLADMENSWPEFISEALTFLQYGWDVHEIVYKFRRGNTGNPTTNSRYDDGLMGWRKFAGRAQETLLHWEFDESGDAIALIQLLPTGGPLLRVPLAKALHFRTRLIKNNPEGVSIMRNAYTSWYYKTKIQAIEAIGIERDLAGIPIAWVPSRLLQADASPEDKQQLASFKKLVQQTVSNEQYGNVMPLAYDSNGNKIYDFTLLNSGGKRNFDTNGIIDRYDQRMLATVLADFIILGSNGVGSFAQSKNKTDYFSIATTGFVDMIASEFNRKAIPDLLAINQLPGRCMMQHGDIAKADLTELSTYVKDLTGVGIIVPDTALEQHLRQEGSLPPIMGTDLQDLNDGGSADGRSDQDPADTVARDQRYAQGRGQNAQAADPDADTIPPVKPGTGVNKLSRRQQRFPRL